MDDAVHLILATAVLLLALSQAVVIGIVWVLWNRSRGAGEEGSGDFRAGPGEVELRGVTIRRTDETTKGRADGG